MKQIEAMGIGYCFIIGGNDSAENGHRLGQAAGSAGLPLSVVNVPKTIDNDLLATDHSPGYGSAARDSLPWPPWASGGTWRRWARQPRSPCWR